MPSFWCYFNQRFPEIGKHQRATERLQKQVFHQHTQGVSQQALAKDFRSGKATIAGWYHKRYQIEHQELKESPFQRLMTLGKTLYHWREEVVRMWRFSKSNGITEGFHRSMELIRRRAYGFKNFENYRLSVKVLCA